MSLPELDLQVFYGRLAWAIVLAAVVLGLWSRWARPSRRVILGVLIVSAVLQLLPGRASTNHWLGLAFQWPSGLLLTLCVLSLRARFRQQEADAFTVMPLPLAAVGAFAGGLLYLDASGWTAFGLYYVGFGPYGAPAVAFLMAALAFVAISLNVWRAHAVALLAALTLFMLLRLPTGNLWDALLDPFLWMWTLVALVRGMKQQHPAPGQLQASSRFAAENSL